MRIVAGIVIALSLSGWVAVENLSAIAQAPITSETTVSALMVFQVGSLLVAGGILVKLGMLLAQWKTAIDKALKFADTVKKIDDRVQALEAARDRQERELARIAMMAREHEQRLNRPAEGIG